MKSVTRAVWKWLKQWTPVAASALWRALVWLVRLPAMTVRGIRKHWEWVLTGLAMTAVTMVFAAITLRIALHGHEVTIPDLTGMTVSEASQQAVHTGLGMVIENKFYSTTVPAGRILAQMPAADVQVRHGWQVRVTESLGPQRVTIPDVAGQQVRDASMNLRRNQLDLGMLAHIDAPGDPERVLAQSPPPNAGVDEPRVSLLLSTSGTSAENAFVLPSFLGMSYTAANRAAVELGLRVAPIGESQTTIVAVNGRLMTSEQARASAGAAAATDAPAAPGGPSSPSSPSSPSGPTMSGPVLAQMPPSGFRASRNDVVRIYFGHVPAQAQ